MNQGLSMNSGLSARHSSSAPGCLLRLRGRRRGSFRNQLTVSLVDGRVMRGQLFGNMGTSAISAALGAYRQGIERARLCAGAQEASRIEKGSEGVGSRQHRSSERLGVREVKSFAKRIFDLRRLPRTTRNRHVAFLLPQQFLRGQARLRLQRLLDPRGGDVAGLLEALVIVGPKVTIRALIHNGCAVVGDGNLDLKAFGKRWLRVCLERASFAVADELDGRRFHGRFDGQAVAKRIAMRATADCGKWNRTSILSSHQSNLPIAANRLALCAK